MPDFAFQEPFPLQGETTAYRLLTRDHVSLARFEGQEIVKVAPEGLCFLAREAMREVSFLLRPSHLEKLAAILGDPESSANDRAVAAAMLRNAEIAAELTLPLCQDTGTATVFAQKGQQIWTGGDDARMLSQGIFETYIHENLRYSQVAALTMYEEVNTGTNLPAQIEISATGGGEYRFLFLAKGGGSANKSLLFQETKALLHPVALEQFLVEKMRSLGTAACPPYHLAFAVGGTSAESCLKTAKLASTGWLDALPSSGDERAGAFRVPELEGRLLRQAGQLGVGAQFGGKHFALDVRVVRLPRHAASCPVAMAVSCYADRNVKAKIDREGIWLEQLERAPGRFLPESLRQASDSAAVRVSLNRPMRSILAELSQHPVATWLSLSGPVVVARDTAHARIRERLESGEGLPRYLKDHPVYYAGPAKTPPGLPSGSFGPTTAGRMDSYVDLFQSHGGSLVMIAKANRSRAVTEACRRHGGFYLGSIGGPAALLASEHIRKVEVLEYPELAMEAVLLIDLVDFPALILVDDRGNDFFERPDH
ncbi:MAG TPA: fumarate hydratase [Myxococcales bacterium]|jgi:fumarate hydratase class I|nr:fumarate hydratase [Myxococcales bacterium]